MMDLIYSRMSKILTKIKKTKKEKKIEKDLDHVIGRKEKDPENEEGLKTGLKV